MGSISTQIRQCIEQKLDTGFRRFVIFPYGEVGIQARNILRDVYGIETEYILHSRLWKYNPAIKPPEFLDTISCDGLCALLATTNMDIYAECKEVLQRYFADEAIAELSSMINAEKRNIWHTKEPLIKGHKSEIYSHN